MFGFSEALLGFIRRQIGVRTDPDSTTGSLHAKVTELRNYLGGLVFGTKWEDKTYTLTSKIISPKDSSITVRDVTGSGFFTVSIFANSSTDVASTSDKITLTITVDGGATSTLVINPCKISNDYNNQPIWGWFTSGTVVTQVRYDVSYRIICRDDSKSATGQTVTVIVTEAAD